MAKKQITSTSFKDIAAHFASLSAQIVKDPRQIDDLKQHLSFCTEFFEGAVIRSLANCSVFPVAIDTKPSIDELVKAADVATSSTEDFEDTPSKKQYTAVMHLLDPFAEDRTSRMDAKDGLFALNRKKLRPANIRELLTFAKMYPAAQRVYNIYAMGDILNAGRGEDACLFLGINGLGDRSLFREILTGAWKAGTCIRLLGVE